MQALILVGGEGTRLRPLTLKRPKPVLPLVGKPFISYMLDWLREHGVDEVVMACGFEPDALRETIGSGDAGQRVRYVVEPDPRGTAGAIRFAKEELQERFFVLNGDVLCDLDLTALMNEHTETQALATIGLYPVADATGYGLVRRDADGWVTEFAEKPDAAEAAAGGDINAGTYVLEHAVVENIAADRAVSIERDVFPSLIGRGLRGVTLDGYWLDIGTPDRFLQASWDILERRVETDVGKRAAPDGLLISGDAEIASEATVRAPAFIGDGVVVEAGAEVGPRAVIDQGSQIGTDAVIERSLIGGGCSVGAGAIIRGAILAPRVEVEPEADLGPGSVFGEDERVAVNA
jgi:mannose-1-phosphate guanylyltransferase